jgi:hypothetical protein
LGLVSDSLALYLQGGAVLTGSQPSSNTWHHVAVSRSSGTLRLFFNGTVVDTQTNNTFNVTSAGGIVSIGANSDGSYPHLGQIDSLRWAKTAYYTSNFTPAGPLT